MVNHGVGQLTTRHVATPRMMPIATGRSAPRHHHGQAICLQKPAAVSPRSRRDHYCRLRIMVETKNSGGSVPRAPISEIRSPSTHRYRCYVRQVRDCRAGHCPVSAAAIHARS